MSLGSILRNSFQHIIGLPSIGVKPVSFLKPELLNPWSVDLIRTKTRNHFPRPNEAKRIRKHGWWTKMATLNGRRTLQRRILKGRYVLSH
ncbi:39S ribosomal protein L34, mitochondrial [Adelges cooleyi]|uniref:39S ribosomal protein L34, mitochondrial n=1 Tax=Adelges cooleyi TaxID=133065 RepID=UPI00217FFFE3|nr:39S ribosomal protein L34, mitochondrial [Adelges cooleyi]